MHVKSLKVFCDVVGRRSFSRAADDNGITQSGASQMVHQLEQQLRVKLIDRSKRPFVLTPEGERYYEGCRKLVQQYYALEEEVRTVQQELAGRVSVASIYTVGLTHLNRFVQEFLSQHPQANVRVEYQHPARVYELVETDQVDLGLLSYPKGSRTIKVIHWREEPMVMVCAPEHPLAQLRSISLAQLDGEKMVGFVDELKIRSEIDRALSEHQAQVETVMEFDNIETIKRAIEINAGLSLLPQPTVEREVQSGTLVAVPLRNYNLVRPLGIIYRHGKELGQTAKRFIQLLRNKEQEPAQAEANRTANGKRKSNGSQVHRKAKRKRSTK